MPINDRIARVSWLDQDQRVVHQYVFGKWDWDDFYAQHTEIVAMMRSVTHPVHLLVQLEDVSVLSIPAGLFTHVRRTLVDFPPNHTSIVAVSNNRLIKALVKVIIKLAPSDSTRNITIVGTLDEACALLGITPEQRVTEEINQTDS